MGNHLHKAIGWAVPYAEDPLDRGSRQAQRTLNDHSVWLRCKATAVTDEEGRDEILHEADVLERSRNILLEQCVVHIPQLDGGTLLIIPPAHLADWSRMDDDLDCAFTEDEPVVDRITYTRSNPFSFSHLWMDALTGRTLEGPVGDAVTRRGTDRGNQAALRVRFQGDSNPAFTHPDEAASRIAPGIPREIVHLAQHLDSFLDPQMLLHLRPARAVWMG